MYGVMLVISLVFLVISILVVVTAFERDQPATVLVGVVGLLVAASGLCLFSGVGLFYQARPVPRSNSQASLMWGPTPLMRAAIAAILVALSTTVVTFTITPDNGTVPDALLILAIALTVLLCFMGGRALVARLEANAWGIRCTTPLTTVRLPWGDLRSLEPRGTSTFSQRIVAVSKNGRRKLLWVFDPRVPVDPSVARLLVAELAAVRRSTARPDA